MSPGRHIPRAMEYFDSCAEMFNVEVTYLLNDPRPARRGINELGNRAERLGLLTTESAIAIADRALKTESRSFSVADIRRSEGPPTR